MLRGLHTCKILCLAQMYKNPPSLSHVSLSTLFSGCLSQLSLSPQTPLIILLQRIERNTEMKGEKVDTVCYFIRTGHIRSTIVLGFYFHLLSSRKLLLNDVQCWNSWNTAFVSPICFHNNDCWLNACVTLEHRGLLDLQYQS